MDAGNARVRARWEKERCDLQRAASERRLQWLVRRRCKGEGVGGDLWPR
jgi:hypothetical protein